VTRVKPMAKRPKHLCTGFPNWQDDGDIVQCPECAQFYVHRGSHWTGRWVKVSSWWARHLMRKYQREQRRIDRRLSRANPQGDGS